ncbi:Protein rhomboid [Pseudolycoriella hygida]|uniref:Protein rhomboid n=1 Tax=Pseudolycoriella hygida TaxID=35572 RepID=A0A9Q0MXL7_9DIPT|nr:Protein rhomboid [Pseudolycoriella hygida]
MRMLQLQNGYGYTEERNLIRQHSTKIHTFAEDVVLPKNDRTLRQAARAEDLSMRNAEAQYPHRSTASICSYEENPQQFPIFLFLISLVQIIVYYSVDGHLMLLLFGYDPHRRHEVWRFVTMMLVHSNASHLWHNVIMQLIFGSFLELVHKWKRIAIIYFASVVGGALFISVLGSSYTVGASGGVYGLAFSHLATLTLNWSEMDKKFCSVFTLSVYIVYDAGFNLFNGLISNNRRSHISHAGHLGGAVTGFLISILVLKNFRIEQWEKKMQKICVAILIGICVIVFIVNVAAFDQYVPVEWNFQKQTQKFSNSQPIQKKCLERLPQSGVAFQELWDSSFNKYTYREYLFTG